MKQYRFMTFTVWAALLTLTALLAVPSITQPTAHAQQAETKVFWANSGVIRQADLDGSNIEDIIDTGVNAWHIDVDGMNRKVYWADISGNIGRANLDGTGAENIITELSQPFVVAVDPENNAVYFSGGNATIEKADLDGSNRQTIVASGEAPYGMALDMVNDHIYWTEFANGRVMRVDMDGQNPTELVTGIESPSGIAVDPVGGKLYWVTYNFTEATMADLDGSNVTTIETYNDQGIAIAVDRLNSKIIYSGRNAVIRQAGLDGSNPDDFITGQSVVQGVAVAQVFPPQTTTVGFTSATTNGAESVADPQLLTITTSDGEVTENDVDLIIQVSIAGTATLDVDYTVPQAQAAGVSGQTSIFQTSYPLTIPAGTASGTTLSAGVTVVDDSDIEDDETIDLVLVTDAQLGIPNTIYTIEDNDMPTVGFTSATTSGAESLADPQLLTVTTPNGEATTEDISVIIQVSESSTATLDVDYTVPQAQAAGVSGQTSIFQTSYPLTIPAGTASGTTLSAGVTVVDDSDIEDDETIDLVLVTDAQLGIPNTIYTIEDNEPRGPMLTTAPAQNATGIKVDANLTFNFSEAVTVNPAGITFTCGEGNIPVQATTFTSTQVVVAPQVNFPFDTTCMVLLPTANITNSNDQSLIDDDGIDANDNTYQYQFTTEVAPQITANFPLNNATDVAVDTTPSVTLNEPVTGIEDEITITCQPGNINVTFDGTLTQNGTVYEMNPFADLPTESTCTVSIPVADGQDSDGNAVVDNQLPNDGLYVFSFDTVGVPPRITGVSPLPNATDVSINAAIRITVSETPLTVNSAPTLTCDSQPQPYSTAPAANVANTFVLTPNAPLPFGAACTLAITTSAITDSKGNPLVDNDQDNNQGIVNLNFTTEAQPAIVASSPTQDATNVAVDANITLTASEVLTPTGQGSVALNCGSENLGFALRAPNLPTYILDPVESLPAGAACTLTIPVNAVADSDGNQLLGNSQDGNSFVLVFNTAVDVQANANAASIAPAAPVIESATD